MMFDGAPYPHEPSEPWRTYDDKAERRARFHDRLKALGAFTGIAIGAIAGFEMVIGGGFDFITPAPIVHEIAPSRYVTVHQVPWSSEMQVVPLSSTEPLFAGFVQTDVPSDGLAGGYDDPRSPDAHYPDIDDEQLYARIDALYADTSEPDYVEASITYEDAPAIDDDSAPEADPYAEAEDMVEQALRGYVADPTLQKS
jgi:hypothetical protein